MNLEGGDLAAAWSRAFIGGLMAAGVDRFFVCPGSRSTPLALAIHGSGARFSVVVDERAAAFAALGHARITGRPAAVVATSGSAPAHFLPAVIEAEASQIPLVVISADRPVELQEAAAPQTIDQKELFGSHVRKAFELGAPDAAALDRVADLAARVVFASLAPLPGAVHVNARFRKPLEPLAVTAPAAVRAPAIYAGAAAPSAEAVAAVNHAIQGAERPCVVAGPSRGPGPRAASTSLPLFAEATSGWLRGEAFSLGLALETGIFEGADAPDLVLEIESPPVPSSYARFAATGIARICVSRGAAQDPFGGAQAFIAADPGPLLAALEATGARAKDYADRVRRRLAGASAALAEEASKNFGEAVVLRSLAKLQAPGSVLVAGNSLIVRDLEAFGAAEIGAEVTVLHQRGASGIDGLIAGAVGTRLATPASARVTLALGDVSALHDVGSFALLASLPPEAGALVVVVVDNAGGRIFEALPVRGLLGASRTFDELYLTQPPAGFLEGVAKAFSVRFMEARSAAALEAAVDRAFGSGGATLIQAVVDPEEGRAARRKLGAAIRAGGAA